MTLAARHTLRPRPWTIHVDGLVHKPKTFDVDELIHLHPLEERVYGLRCVEAWSMVIPWIGFSRSPHSSGASSRPARRSTSSSPPWSIRASSRAAAGFFFGFSSLDWPYVEGLRLDEAVHP